MKSLRKTVASALAFCMLAAALAGCSSQGGGQANTGSSSGSSGSAKTKLTFSMWDPMPAGNDFIKAFMEANDDIEIELLSFPDDNYSTKVNTMVAGNNAPDVMLLWECDIPNFASAGQIVNLDTYISESSVIDLDDMLPAMTTLSNMNGANYGLPWCFATQIMYYNKDMFDAANLAYPSDNWTWDDYADAASKLTIRDGNMVSQWGDAGLNHPGVWYSMIGAGGDDIIGLDGGLSLGDGAKAALQWQYDLINTYKVSPEISADRGASDLFAAGRAAMIRMGSWMCSGYRDVPFNWDIATLPAGNRKYAGLHTGFFTINEKCANKDAAWRFIEFCMSASGQKMIIEGFGNPSAVLNLNEQGLHRVQGTNGPSHWEVFDKSAEIAEFGYTLLPAGVTNDLVKKFEAAVMGQVDIDTALSEGISEANKVLGR